MILLADFLESEGHASLSHIRALRSLLSALKGTAFLAEMSCICLILRALWTGLRRIRFVSFVFVSTLAIKTDSEIWLKWIVIISESILFQSLVTKAVF
jgi:hypothetical protein